MSYFLCFSAAKTDMQNENGYTPLHLAAYRGVLVEVIHENGIVRVLMHMDRRESIIFKPFNQVIIVLTKEF